MEKIKILAVGTNLPILATIERLINKEEQWLAVKASGVDEACSICEADKIALVLLGAGLSDEEEELLKERLNGLRPGLPVVKHYGGGSGLLYAEIYQGLEKN